MAPMAHEIELKLALPESAQRAFLRHPLLKVAIARQSAQLVSIYYDTPDLALRKSGVAVRLRRQGNAWLQTVKCTGSSAGGLSARPEWEGPYGEHFDFSGIDDAAVRARLEKRRIRTRLAPVFETLFRRTTWTFDGFQLMFDCGWIAAGEHREALSELELELTGGNLKALFDLAEKLAERLPLMPALLSKAERGFRLRQGTPATPVKAREISLDPGMPPLAAFRAIALSCMEQMQGNHAGIVAAEGGEDPEYIHQMRVATRRLRAAMRLFAPLLPPGFAEALLPPLREMMARLGAARDLDVLFAEIAAPVLQALPDEPRLAALAGIITNRRHAARADAVRHLRAPQFGRLMMRLTALLNQPALVTPEPGVAATDFANERLRKLRRKVRRLGAAARIDDPVSLHVLRIGIKRLRYALEFFAPLARGKERRRLARQLADGQGTLGELNDLANAGRLLMDCASNDERLREAVTLIAGWHGPRHARMMRRLPELLSEVRSSKVIA
jgi:inorganic triphosphatase YgiF